MKYLSLLFAAVIFLAGCKTEPDVITLEQGHRIVIDSVGTGEIVKAGDFITVEFDGWMINEGDDLFSDWHLDSTKMMQSIGSTRFTKPHKFILGEGSFVKGSDEAIIGMNVGETRTIIIPSHLAYGEAGIGPVPPNTDLKLTIKVIESRVPKVVKQWDVDESKLKKTKSGLQYAIIEEGTGAQADSGKLVTVHYSGFLTDGKKFDSSVERDEPFSFVVGIGMVIRGWDEGIQLLREGSTARFVIPSEIAYGSQSNEVIPPNATLIFDVQLLKVEEH